MLLNALTIAEKFSTGGITALVGILMTFIMLIILIGCVFLMNYIIKKSKVLNENRKDKKQNSEPASLSDYNNEKMEEIDTIEDSVLDEKTLNAINSAVDMYMAQGENGKKHTNYTIKHIKKV